MTRHINASLFIKALVWVYPVLLLVSCVSTDQGEQREAYLPKFFIEAIGPELKSNKIVSVQLPISASVIQIKPIPSIPYFDIKSARIAQGEMGPYLEFELTSRSRLNLMQLCGEYRGRRLVLVIGQLPVGSWRINKVLENGLVSTYVEYPEETLPELVKNVNAALESRRSRF